MKPLGWVFLISSLTFVWGLVGWCFYRVFSRPPDTAGQETESSDRSGG